MKATIRIALVAAVVLVAAACTTSESTDTTTSTATTSDSPDTTTPTTTTTTTTTATTTTPATVDVPIEEAEAALSIKDEFFIAFNSGDQDAVMALFTEEARFVESSGVEGDPSEFESLLAWNIAQGTRYTPSDCVVSTQDAGVVRVACPFKNHDILTLEVGGPPVPIRMWMDTTEAGIVAYFDQFGQPDFNTVGIPFGDWMTTHHPDDAEAAGFGAWTTIDEAVAFGELRAGYAEEWAAYLDENGCVYTDGC